MIVILLAIALGSGQGIQPPQRCDLIEVNTVLTDEGKEAYTQVIFREWSPDYRRHHIMGWMIPRGLSEFPVKVGHKWVSRWTFGRKSFHIEAKMLQETRTVGDPERVEKLIFDEKLRTPLRSGE